MNSLKTMKLIHKKWKQGHKVTNIPEFFSLIDLCSSDERTERLTACKCIFYLWDWKVIDNRCIISVLPSVASKGVGIDGVLAVYFSVVSQLCEEGDATFLRIELPLFQRSLTTILTTHEPAVLATLSVFDQMDFDFVIKHYKPIVYDIMFGDFTNRSIIWSLVTKRSNTDFYRSILLWLKFHNLEDCFILLGSLKIMDISDTEKCLYLSVLIRNFMALGQNSQEAVNMLKEYILNTSNLTQSLVMLTVLVGLDSFSQQYLFAAFNLYEWFLQNTILWTEILWMMLVFLLPFTKTSVFYPVYQEKALKLISVIKGKIETGKSIELKLSEMESVIFKYTVYRHDCLHQSLLIIRILLKFKNDDCGLIHWLKLLLTSSHDARFTTFDAIVGKYFLTRNSELKQLCLSILTKYNGGNIYLYIFQLQRESDPIIINEILHAICAQSHDTVIIHQFLKSLSEYTHDRSFSVSLALLISACKNGYKLDDELHSYLQERNNLIDLVTQAELVKELVGQTNTNFDEIILFCNRSINSAKMDGGNLSTSLVIDTICIMCEKGILDVTIIWDSLLKIVAGEQHVAIHNSVCHFLSRIPALLKHREDENLILYKSARVLWHFANDSNINQNLALRCLRDYDLDIFDSSFLSDECQTHARHSFDESVVTPLKGICWVHIMKNDSIIDLFIHYINKFKSKAKFRGPYGNLFDGLINYLSTCYPEDGDNITICLKLLSANWTNIPSGKDLNCLDRFISNSSGNSDFRHLIVYVLLNFFPYNHSAKFLFEKFLAENTSTEKEKATLCLLPANLLGKYHAVNEEILFDGLLFAFSIDSPHILSDETLSSALEKVVIHYANNYATPVIERRIIMKVLFTLWIKASLNSEVFKRVSHLIAVIYGYPFLKSIASQMEGEMCRKYIYLSKQIALHSKLMRCFDINLGLRHPSFQDEVIVNLIYVLKNIGHENNNRNLKWMLRVLCMCAMSTNDYLCKVVIYGMNHLSGVSMFITTDSLKENLDCFPLAASVISKLTRKGRNITFTMNEIVRKTLRIHSAFTEVFKLSVFRIRDEPSITYETVTKKCLE